MASVDNPAGVIHDIGYQRYTGPRLGRGYITRSLYVHSLRSAFGLGRSGKAKVFPFIVVGLAFAVAREDAATKAFGLNVNLNVAVDIARIIPEVAALWFAVRISSDSSFECLATA